MKTFSAPGVKVYGCSLPAASDGESEVSDVIASIGVIFFLFISFLFLLGSVISTSSIVTASVESAQCQFYCKSFTGIYAVQLVLILL